MAKTGSTAAVHLLAAILIKVLFKCFFTGKAFLVAQACTRYAAAHITLTFGRLADPGARHPHTKPYAAFGNIDAQRPDLDRFSKENVLRARAFHQHQGPQ